MEIYDFLINRPLSWIGNLTEDKESKVKINYSVSNIKNVVKKIEGEEKQSIKVDILIDDILSNPNYRTHIIKFCSSGKEGITDKEYVSMTLNLAQDVYNKIEEYGGSKIYVSSINCRTITENKRIIKKIIRF